ncbi:MAG: HPF/RaiA family ribosome-associated protein [Xanthomonadales bacterium]|nr:HPF/RaiA family ribosome-associated protein [Xanthomonadales bacterium]MCB1634492.1 HPF/RaiA family ribosome-associated protein [Xanthomonadales bacterium]
MRIQLLSRVSVEDHDHDSLVQRQVRFLLDRFNRRLHALRIRLVDENGPKGGVDQRALVTAELVDGGQLHSEARSTEVMSALDHALRRLARQLAERSRKRARPRRVPAQPLTGDL